MMVFIAILSAVFNLPVLIGLLSIVFFASIGISLGVRRAYIKVLLKIFEVCTTFATQTHTNILFSPKKNLSTFLPLNEHRVPNKSQKNNNNHNIIRVVCY